MGGLVEKPDKKRSAYQITQKGQEYLDNPPPEPPEKMAKRGDERGDVKIVEKTSGFIQEAETKKPLATPPVTPSLPQPTGEVKTEKKDDSVIPSQADIFRSIAEQLGITKAMDTAKGGTPLNAIINYVQRTGLLNIVPFRTVDQHNRLQPRICHISRCYRQGSQDHSPPAGRQPQRGSFQADSASTLLLKALSHHRTNAG